MLKLVCFSFLLFLVKTPLVIAQEITAKQQQDFANQLYKNKEYYRAITEYERFLFFFPEHPASLRAKIQIGKAYQAGKNYQAAIDYWQQIQAENPLLENNDIINLLYAIAWLDKDKERIFYYRQENIKQSIAILKKLNPNLTTANLDFAKEWNAGQQQLAKKSPLVAGTLSAIIPGLGSAYNSRYKEAFYAFFITSLFISATLEAQKQNDVNKTSVFGFFALAFYGGNIYTAVNGAYKYNELSKQHYLQNLRTRYDLFFP